MEMPVVPVRNTLALPAHLIRNASLLFLGPIWMPKGRGRENRCIGKKATCRCRLPVTKVLSLSIQTEVFAHVTRALPSLVALSSWSAPSGGQEGVGEDKSTVKNQALNVPGDGTGPTHLGAHHGGRP